MDGLVKRVGVVERLVNDMMGFEVAPNGFDIVQLQRGFRQPGTPTAELERLVISRMLWHGGHPVLRWNAANVAVRTDPAGNIKPDKERSRDRIDGISALINAIGRATVGHAGSSVYESRGLLVF